MTARRPQQRRFLVLAVALLAAGWLAAGWLASPDREPPEVAVQAPVVAPPPEAPVALEPPAPPDRVAASPASPPRLDGFCAAHDAPPSTFQRPGLYRTLTDRWLRLQAALRALPDADRVQVEAALDQLDRLVGVDAAFARLARLGPAAQGGLDFGAEGLLSAGRMRLAMQRPREALDAARLAQARAPEDEGPLMLEAAARQALGEAEAEAALAPLRRAHALRPAEPAVAWALASLLRDRWPLTEAQEALGAYLRAEPDDVEAAQLLARLGVQADIQKDYAVRERDGVTLLFDRHALDEGSAEALLREVDLALDDAAHFTGTPRRARLLVVVYPGHEELLAVACVNAWAGALFDGVLRIVAVAGRDPVPHVEVRHEALHAQLSPAIPSRPFWFHEGVASLFAGQQRDAAFQKGQAQMLQNRTCIPFSSLEGPFWDFQDTQDARLAYAQSLAMVQLVLDVAGPSGVVRLTQELGAGAPPARAVERVAGRPLGCTDLWTDLASRQ